MSDQPISEMTTDDLNSEWRRLATIPTGVITPDEKMQLMAVDAEGFNRRYGTSVCDTEANQDG